MTTAERTSGGFPMGWVIVALLLAAVVVLAPMMVMPVEMIDAADYECGGKTEAKAPADMTEEELQAALDVARRAALAAKGAAQHDALIAHGKLLDEYAHRRGWDLFDMATVANVSYYVMDIPGEGTVEVAGDHIYENHGAEAMEAVQTGGWKNGDCNGGQKAYAYKLADDGRWWLRIKWDGKIVTCFKATWEYLLWCFKQDGCDPPRPPFSHDGMSSPAY